MRRRFFAIFALMGAFGLFLSSVASADPVTRSVSGTLVNSCSDTGDPVGIWMVVWDGSTQISSATVGVGGGYMITNVPPGNYTVSPYSPAGCGSVPDRTAVDLTTSDATGIDFELVKVFSIVGTVTGCPGADGVGASDVTLNLLDAGTQIATTTTDDSGDYFFQYKPAKDGYSVEVVPGSGCGADPAVIPVNLSTNDVTGVDFALTADGCDTGSSFGSVDLSTIFGSLGSSEFCSS